MSKDGGNASPSGWPASLCVQQTDLILVVEGAASSLQIVDAWVHSEVEDVLEMLESLAAECLLLECGRQGRQQLNQIGVAGQGGGGVEAGSRRRHHAVRRYLSSNGSTRLTGNVAEEGMNVAAVDVLLHGMRRRGIRTLVATCVHVPRRIRLSAGADSQMTLARLTGRRRVGGAGGRAEREGGERRRREGGLLRLLSSSRRGLLRLLLLLLLLQLLELLQLNLLHLLLLLLLLRVQLRCVRVGRSRVWLLLLRLMHAGNEVIIVRCVIGSE